MRILMTGGAGKLATLVRPRLARPGRVLRLLDIAPIEPAVHEEVVVASVTDLPAVLAAAQDTDAIVHLGGLSTEGPWDQMLSVNVDGTRCVLEAARRAQVPRVILASSNHAVGFHPIDGGVAPDYLYPRPDTYYGFSKAALEALGSLYHDRYGLDVICVRIGSCVDQPSTRRMLSTWLSPADCARMLEAALTAPSPGFRLVWGVSANTRGRFSLDEGRRIGYEPLDDAELFAGTSFEAEEFDDLYVGGPMCSPSFRVEDTQ